MMNHSAAWTPVNVELLKEAVISLKNSGVSILFSSHRMEHVEELCENLCILQKGRPVVQGKLKEIKRSFGKKNVTIHSDDDLRFLQSHEGILQWKETADGVKLQIANEDISQEIFAMLQGKGFIRKFELEEPSLHDIFIEKVGPSMNKFWIMLSHTYKNKIMAKSFIISTVITVLLVLVVTNLESIISLFQGDDAKEKIAVVDETNELYPVFSKQLKAVDTDGDLDVKLSKQSEDEVTKQVKDESLDGMLIIKRDEKGTISGTYKALTISDESTYQTLQQALTQTKTAVGTAELGVSQETISSLYAPVTVGQKALKEGAKSEEELGQTVGLVYIMLFVIYFSVIMYASMIAMEVATEKSSRVMEILISSMPPIQQMFAKLLGIGLVGITQLAIIIGAGSLSLKLNQKSETASSVGGFLNLTDVSATTVIYAVIFFLLGYFLYATLAAFLGSVVSRIEDVQQTITPMTLLVVAGFMIAMFGLNAPDAGFITVTSFIPFFTPMIMFLRVGMLDIPFWQAAVGIGITLLTIVILAVIGARIYKGGVLIYGNSSAFKAIKQALRLAKN